MRMKAIRPNAARVIKGKMIIGGVALKDRAECLGARLNLL